MAQIAPFQPYRYSQKAGHLNNLVTQPYDKIYPDMQQRYLTASPYNLVRIILGERKDTDSDTDNVYTRAAGHFQNWIAEGILVREERPSIYAYSQQFQVPDSGETLVRKGFIALGSVVDYEAKVVHRHEQTLSGPKKDRRMVLDHTRAHFGQIFMLYPDPECRIDALLDKASCGKNNVACVTDEYGTVHALYRIDDPEQIAIVQQAMSDKKLLIADGHHRYETALQYMKDNPDSEDARWVMMTFVNMHSNGLRILPTHRVIAGLDNFSGEQFLQKAAERFRVCKYDVPLTLRQALEEPHPERIRIGVAFQDADGIYLLERDRQAGDLDVQVVHGELIEGALGINQEAVRDQKYIKYVRGLEAATDMVADGEGQIAFLLEATTVEQVADTSFGGGVMPQKSTDFYPKLLSGLTIYKLEK